MPTPARADQWFGTDGQTAWGVQLKNWNQNAKSLALAKQAGATYVRRGFIWGAVEKAAGHYDFRGYDKFVTEAEQQGLHIVACIALGNDKVHPPVTTTAGRAAYARYAAALAKRYQGKKIIWELWNEPNTQTFWGKHARHNSKQFADEYTALVKAAAKAIKAADPKAIVVAGAVSNLWAPSYTWQKWCFANGILDSGIDGWSLHPYGFKRPEAYFEAYAKVRSMLAAAGKPNFPLLNSERGFKPQFKQCNTKDPACAYKLQTRYLIRQLLVDQATDMELSIWYEWSGKDGFALYDTPNQKAMLNALDVVQKELRGYSFVKRIPLNKPEHYALRYEQPGKPAKLVVWAEDNRPADIQLPLTTHQTVQVVDMNGKRQVLKPAPTGQVSLRIRGRPRYITL